MRVGGTLPYAKLESHLDLGDGVAEIRWRRVGTPKGRRKASRKLLPGTNAAWPPFMSNRWHSGVSS